MDGWIPIDSSDGGRFDAWLAVPPGRKKPAPGIVVLQEIWGVNEHIRAVATQYASDGFVVLAPDLFWRAEPHVELDYDEGGTRQAFGFRKSIDLALADLDIAATVEALEQRDDVAGGVAVVGFCMGGLLAYRAAARAEIDCAIAYYGGGIADQLDLVPSIEVPIAFHFGEKDAHISPAAVDAVRSAMAERDEVRIDTYPDADHGFNCWARASYHQRSAALAHGRSLAFLATHLGA